jgi:hypothetical protein
MAGEMNSVQLIDDVPVTKKKSCTGLNIQASLNKHEIDEANTEKSIGNPTNHLLLYLFCIFESMTSSPVSVSLRHYKRTNCPLRTKDTNF